METRTAWSLTSKILKQAMAAADQADLEKLFKRGWLCLKKWVGTKNYATVLDKKRLVARKCLSGEDRNSVWSSKNV